MYSSQTLLPSMHLMLLVLKHWDISYVDLMHIVAASKSYTEVLRKCKSSTIKSHYTMKKILAKLNISTEHFIKRRKRVKFVDQAIDQAMGHLSSSGTMEYVTHMDDIYDPEKVQDILDL